MSALVVFEGDGIEITPDPAHEWLAPSDEVAFGLGVSAEALRSAKSRNAAELVEGKHWVVADRNTLGGTQKQTLWTKRGVIRLGFLITSDRAKRFRDFAEDLVLAQVDTPQFLPQPAYKLPESFSEALRLLATSVDENERKDRVIEALEPAAAFADKLASAQGDYDVREAAQTLARDKTIKTGRGRLFDSLKAMGWIDKTGQPYQSQVDCGRLARRVSSFEDRSTGEVHVRTQVRITTKGLQELHRRLGGQIDFNLLLWPELGLRVVGS